MPAEIRIVVVNEGAPGIDDWHMPAWDRVPFKPTPSYPTPKPSDGLAAEPAWDRVEPKPPTPSAPRPVAHPAPRLPGTSSVPAFDRPQAVVIMGPRPLPVTMVGGTGGGSVPSPRTPGARPEPRRQTWAEWGANRLNNATAATGRSLVGVARNSGMTALLEGAGMAGGALARLGPWGMAAAAAVQTLGTAARAVVEVMNALAARGREIAPYSAQLSGAVATADIRKLQADIGEAQRIGPALGRLIDAQSRAEATLQRLLEPLKSFVADRLAQWLESQLKVSIGILEGIEKLTPRGFDGELKDMIKDMKAILAGDTANLDKIADAWLMGPIGVAPVPVNPGFGGGAPGIPVLR